MTWPIVKSEDLVATFQRLDSAFQISTDASKDKDTISLISGSDTVSVGDNGECKPLLIRASN